MKTMTKTALIAAGLVASSATWAVGTDAGAIISNTATATFDDPTTGNTGTTSATAPDITVAELINVNVTADDATPVSTQPGDTDQVLTYTVTNTGNGTEAFTLDAANLAGDDLDADNITIYADTDNDGVFNPANDLPVTADIVLDADEDVTIFVVGDIPATGVTGEEADVSLTATSATPGVAGATPGTLIPGQGTNTPSGAVVGNNPTDTDTGTFVVGEILTDATVDITKAIESREDPFGGTTDIPGTVVTYLITVTAKLGDVNNLVVADTIPLDLTYVANSVTVDSVATTDAADADTVEVTGADVAVSLGTVTQDTTIEIRLQATIN
jgi:uncharacterized repeat protein (TIGR01451 family)